MQFQKRQLQKQGLIWEQLLRCTSYELSWQLQEGMKTLLLFCFPVISGPDRLLVNPGYKLEQIEDYVSPNSSWSDTYCYEQSQPIASIPHMPKL